MKHAQPSAASFPLFVAVLTLVCAALCPLPAVARANPAADAEQPAAAEIADSAALEIPAPPVAESAGYALLEPSPRFDVPFIVWRGADGSPAFGLFDGPGDGDKPQSTTTAAPAQSAVPGEASPAVAPQSDVPQKQSFQWKTALISAGMFLAVEQGFRLGVDPAVRAPLEDGPFWADYYNSVKSIHGWNDGDPFIVNYIGHPVQGAISGFIEIGADPRYRTAEFGKSHRYWVSRMRAMAFAAAYSLQFEIGPISEASIGNTQSFPGAHGIVDWVITPTVGTGWIVLEDVLDRYLIKPVEVHSTSPTKMGAMRILLNPSRSFSNLMQRHVPWHRDARPDVMIVAENNKRDPQPKTKPQPPPASPATPPQSE